MMFLMPVSYTHLDVYKRQGLEYPAWVETEEETQIIMIPSATFKSVFKNESIVQFYVFEALSGRLFEMMQLLEETASFGLEARIAALLLRKSQGQGFIEITHCLLYTSRCV